MARRENGTKIKPLDLFRYILGKLEVVATRIAQMTGLRNDVKCFCPFHQRRLNAVSGSVCYSHIFLSSSGCQHAAEELLPVLVSDFPSEPSKQVSRAD